MNKYEELSFTDDFMFCKVLTTNPELCHELLELIIGKKVGAFARLDQQKPIEITAESGLTCTARTTKMLSMTARCRQRITAISQNVQDIIRG